jgi:uncharacterized protein (UPF0147 family)
MNMNDDLAEIVAYIDDFTQEDSIPKSVKTKLQMIVSELKSADETTLSLRVNESLSLLDELSGDNNLDQFTRQQIWSISSMLEGLN